jgi:hypothetical protein
MLLLAASEQAGNDERAGTQKVVATRTFRTPIRKLSGIGHVRSHGQVLGESSANRKLSSNEESPHPEDHCRRKAIH